MAEAQAAMPGANSRRRRPERITLRLHSTFFNTSRLTSRLAPTPCRLGSSDGAGDALLPGMTARRRVSPDARRWERAAGGGRSDPGLAGATKKAHTHGRAGGLNARKARIPHTWTGRGGRRNVCDGPSGLGLVQALVVDGKQASTAFFRPARRMPDGSDAPDGGG